MASAQHELIIVSGPDPFYKLVSSGGFVRSGVQVQSPEAERIFIING